MRCVWGVLVPPIHSFHNIHMVDNHMVQVRNLDRDDIHLAAGVVTNIVAEAYHMEHSFEAFRIHMAVRMVVHTARTEV